MVDSSERINIDQGRALIQTGRVAEATALLEDVARRDPANAEAWHFLGVANALLGDTAEAESNFREALSRGSSSAHTPYNLANVLLDQGKVPEAIEQLLKTLEINPGFFDALTNLTLAYVKHHQFEMAVETGRRAVAAQPESFEAHTNLGLAYLKSRQPEEAAKCYLQAIRQRPNDAEAQVRYGTALSDMMRYTEAAACFSRALQLDSGSVSALFRTADNLLAQARVDEAIAAYRALLEINPEHAGAAHGLLFTLNYLPSITQAEIAAEHRAWAQRHYPVNPAVQQYDNSTDRSRRLRIGYVSADFRKHSVAYFIGPVLTAHDRGRIEIYCYSDVDIPDSTTEWLKSLATHWRDISCFSDTDTARLVRDDKIDILVDLSGHSGNSRLGVFCLEPAPVQASYLGYPNTTGLSQIDFRLTDGWADPHDQDAFYSEKLYRLPDGFLCYGPWGEAPTVMPLPAQRSGYITYGSFNNLAKVNAVVIELWAQLLKINAGGRLLLKNHALADESVRKRILDEFMRFGIESSRLELFGLVDSTAAHLDLYNRIDVGLDTFPYNGTTTTCEALWMGVPVVTLAGNRHAGRVGVSILSHLGLNELIADAPDEYIRIASELANDRKRLTILRADLRDRMAASPICDAELFTRNLEAAYRKMWHEWCTNPRLTTERA